MYSVHDLIPAALTELLRQGPMSQGKLEVAWRAAVGNGLSRVTTVRLLDAGRVEVSAADHRWYRELQRSAPVILDRLKALLGAEAVTHVVLQGGPAPRRRPAKHS